MAVPEAKQQVVISEELGKFHCREGEVFAVLSAIPRRGVANPAGGHAGMPYMGGGVGHAYPLVEKAFGVDNAVSLWAMVGLWRLHVLRTNRLVRFFRSTCRRTWSRIYGSRNFVGLDRDAYS